MIATTLAILWLVGVAGAQSVEMLPDCACISQRGKDAARRGIVHHERRRLDEASAEYAKALEFEKPREPDTIERDLVLRVAPRLFVTATEPFGLRDAAAILHPGGRWIAYHLFWEDDIDFPDDNDPCDHEVVWVELDDAKEKPAGVYAYFHGRIAKAEKIEPGRVPVAVQWGKHGSLPPQWWNQVEDEMRRTWEKLSTKGRDAQESPLARGWPNKFAGTWEDFVRFPKEVDLAGLLRKRGQILVSCLNSPVINRHFLRYNFRAKVEWPGAMCR